MFQVNSVNILLLPLSVSVYPIPERYVLGTLIDNRT